MPHVLEIYRHSEDFLALGPVPHAFMEMVEADIEKSGRCGGRFCVIENLAGVPIGVLDFALHQSARMAFLELLMIAREHRRKRYGGSVVASLQGYLRQRHGTRRIDAGVQANNVPGIRFWKSCGFRIDVTPHALADGTEAYDMSKKLDKRL